MYMSRPLLTMTSLISTAKQYSTNCSKPKRITTLPTTKSSISLRVARTSGYCLMLLSSTLSLPSRNSRSMERHSSSANTSRIASLTLPSVTVSSKSHCTKSKVHSSGWERGVRCATARERTI